MPPEKGWRLSLLANALLSASVAHAALAPTNGRVAIVFTEGIDEERGVLHDLPLELAVERFDVIATEKESTENTGAVAFERARAGGANSILHVVRGAGDIVLIEIFIVAPDGIRLRDTVPCPPSDKSDLASVRAVEVMRAALLEAPEPSQPAPKQAAPAQPPPPPPPLPKTEPILAAEPAGPDERGPRFAAGVLPTVLIAGRSPLALFELGLNAEYLPTNHLGFELAGAFPLRSSTESASQATARVHAGWVVAGASYFFLPRPRLLRPFVGVRAGALLLDFDTTGYFPFVGGSGGTTVFFGALAAGASLRVFQFLGLRAEASVGFATPQVVLKFDGAEIDRIALPLVQLGLGPEVTW